MATAPQIKLRDGSGFTLNLVMTTNQDYVIIEGQVDANTADIQVSVNGAAFVSDSTLVDFDLPAFTVPNPASFPDGLLLAPGVNTILIRTIDIVGGVSGSSSATIVKVREADIPLVDTPSSIRLRKRRDSVDILAAIPKTEFTSNGIPIPTDFRGFNFYASTTPGGTTGYYKINEKLVTVKSAVFEEDATVIASESTTWTNGNKQRVKLELTEIDSFNNELAVRLTQTYDVSAFNDNLRFKSTLEDQKLTEFISFRHVRGGGPGIINEDQFAGVQDAEPLYYVVSSVYFNPVNGQEIESPFSQEVLGNPLVIDTAIRDLPPRKADSITVSFIQAIHAVDAEIALIPGSTTRDVSIDPFASEAERLYFLIDFVHRAQSFLTLLQVDDANNDGVSDPVESSSYKTALRSALGFTTNSAVQNLIDQAFDKLAANANKRRLPGRPAVGQAVFFTTTKPTFDLPVASGSFCSTDADSSLNIPAIRFRIGGTFVLPAVGADAYYSYDRKRYELVVDIVAETIGSNGNRPAGQIKTASGVSGLQVTSLEATVFGTDRETNSELAARAMLGFVSVDAGTEGGYQATTAEQVGIIKAKVVKSGDALMMRDYDEVRHKHIGGKVDIWVQGLRERQVTETFAFTFEIAQDIICQIIDLATLTFRVQDSRVTPTTPIVEILDNVVQGLGVRNVTQGMDYDLTGVIIVDYQTFRVNPALVGQPVTAIDDVIAADYRFRVINQFKFSFQPVRRVTSVVGQVSGALDPLLGYDLDKSEDPLLEGESTIASDFLVINQVGGVPLGNSIVKNDEEHVLIGFIEEPLLSIGINTKTIRVFNEARTIEYDGPSAAVPDYEILDGTPTTPVRIVRTAVSDIANGSTVSVDYTHDENFTVTYVINDLLQQLQRTLNVRRHVTADVVVKQAVQNSIEMETTVQLLKGSTRDKVDPEIRSNVSLELNRRTIGQGTAQSDLINAIDSTPGVDFQIVPMARMAYADGSRKLREAVPSNNQPLPSLDVAGNKAYILTGSLKFPTTDGGGLETEHKGVFQDDELMTLAGTLETVASGSKQAFIIGSGGAIITGYTDAATLLAAGFVTGTDQAAELLRRTANHVVVSITGGGSPVDIPDNHKYVASYVVRGDSGAKDMTASGVEFLDMGSLTITYRTA